VGDLLIRRSRSDRLSMWDPSWEPTERRNQNPLLLGKGVPYAIPRRETEEMRVNAGGDKNLSGWNGG